MEDLDEEPGVIGVESDSEFFSKEVGDVGEFGEDCPVGVGEFLIVRDGYD